MFIEHIFAIFSSLFILFLAILAKKRIGYYFNPVSIFCFFWFLYIFFPAVFIWDVKLNIYSLLYINIFNSLFFISIYFYRWKGFYGSEYPILGFSVRSFSLGLLAIATIVSIIALIIDLYIQGLIGFSFFEIGTYYADRRYNDGLVQNSFSKIGTSLSLICPIVGGLCFFYIQKRRKLITAFAFSPSVFLMLFQSAKGGFFLALAFFLGSFLAESFKNRKTSVNLFKIIGIKKLLIFTVFVFVIVISSFLSRGAYDLDFDRQVVFLKYYLSTYAFGHLYAFSDWFADFNGVERSFIKYYINNDIYPGYITFTSFYNLLGIKFEMPLGVYDEFLLYPDIFETNLYTFYRGIITDFGLIGSLLFSFFIGVFSIFMYRSYFRRGGIFSSLYMVYFFAISYQSYIISTLTWVTIPFSFCVVAFIYRIIVVKRVAV